MYETLYEAWLKEKEHAELQELPSEFYIKVANYIGRIRQEGRMLDQKSTKGRLISRESANAGKLVKELVELRLKKIIESTASKKDVEETMAKEEETVISPMRTSIEDYQSLLEDVLRGKATFKKMSQRSEKELLRFTEEVPAIVGADLRTYGPFSIEDIATLPAQNAKVLAERGVATKIQAV